MNDCIFCKIIKGAVPSTKVYENNDVFAFHDLRPQAKVHLLVVPKEHFKDLVSIEPKKLSVVGKIYEAINEISKDLGLDKSGFRVAVNNGPHGCQSVFHLHFHLLGGEQLGGSMSGTDASH